MQIRNPKTVERRGIGGNENSLRQGSSDNRVLLAGTEGSPHNYRAQLSYAETDYLTPRHRHNFDQIRYNIRGDLYYEKDKLLPAGWVAYFPEGTFYGPQVRKQGLYMLLCQFGGASGQGFMSDRQIHAGFDAVKSKGKVANGAFSSTNEKGEQQQQDSFEAIWEQAQGRRLKYPTPRYNEVITMNPEAFNWVDSEVPGVAHKWMGTFTERFLRIGFIRIDAGATYNGGLCRAPELLLMTKGSVTCQNENYSVDTGISFEAMEGPVPIKAGETAEFLVIQLGS